MLSLKSVKWARREVEVKHAGRDVTEVVHDIVIEAHCDRTVSSALLKKWGGQPGIREVTAKGRKVTIIVDGELSNQERLQRFGSRQRAGLERHVINTLNRL